MQKGGDIKNNEISPSRKKEIVPNVTNSRMINIRRMERVGSGMGSSGGNSNMNASSTTNNGNTSSSNSNYTNPRNSY